MLHHNSMAVVPICMMGINSSALYNGYIPQIISYIIEMVIKLWSAQIIVKRKHIHIVLCNYWCNKVTLTRLILVYTLEKTSLHIMRKMTISKVSDLPLHSAVHDVTSCELNLPPMSCFTTWGLAELLKLDLERWITRLWHDCHGLPQQALKPTWAGIKCLQTLRQCGDLCGSLIKERHNKRAAVEENRK